VPRSFALTFDYRCPYARIAHDHVVTALEAGADWDVRFLPFSLSQAHVEEGGVDVWDDPQRDSGILGLQTGVAVRDGWPDRFLAVHRGLFDLRHVHARSLNDRDAVAKVLVDAGLDADAVLAEVNSGRQLATIRDEHTSYVQSHHVWGVPTFVVGDRAVFVRLLHGPDGDGSFANATIERVLDQIEWPILNEFKHTSIPR
jgi:2-hydroxychromene-2-carboxylate isomerase